MLIVGFGLIVSAVSVYLIWRGIYRCLKMWRTRNTKRRTK